METSGRRHLRRQLREAMCEEAIWEETSEERHLGKASWDDSGQTWDLFGPIWDHLGSSEIIWGHLEASGIISDHLRSSRIMCDYFESSGIIWDHLGLFKII